MNKLLMIFALTIPFSAMADEQAANAQMGEETRAWTDLQKSGAASSKAAQPMPGEIADKVYDRYLKSFDYQIPEKFERESIVGGGGSGGQ